MDPIRRFAVGNLAVVVVALGHALATWPTRAVLALFAGGAAIAFLAEAVVVRAGLLEHEIPPRVLGVPLLAVAAWPAVVYLALRVAGLALPAGVAAAAGAAVLATALDLPTERQAVEAGVWRYPEHPLSEPRLAGAPWWNYAGWLGIVFATAMLPRLLA